MAKTKQPKPVTEYSFTLPIPPSVNNYWRIFNNRIVVTAEARAYKDHVHLLLANKLTPLDGEVAINFTVYRPAKRGDLDNYAKVMLDALQGLAYHNDNQVVEIHAFRDDDPQVPRVEFFIYLIDK